MAKICLRLPKGCPLSAGTMAMIRRGIELVVADLFLSDRHPDIVSAVCRSKCPDGITVRLSDGREKLRSVTSGSTEKRIRFICGIFGFDPASVSFAPLG